MRPFDLVIFDCDGVREVLETLDVPSCVASQSPLARVGLALEVTGLAAHLGARVFTASMVPRPKPHPDLFLYAAARMGADPERALAAAGATTFGAMHELPALLAGVEPRRT